MVFSNLHHVTRCRNKTKTLYFTMLFPSHHSKKIIRKWLKHGPKSISKSITIFASFSRPRPRTPNKLKTQQALRIFGGCRCQACASGHLKLYAAGYHKHGEALPDFRADAHRRLRQGLESYIKSGLALEIYILHVSLNAFMDLELCWK